MAGFIAARDSFYLASVSETGWPYLQHRGGPAGFLRVLDETTLGFADLRGNRQYLSLGNLTADDRLCLFLMDYGHRARLKIIAGLSTVARSSAIWAKAGNTQCLLLPVLPIHFRVAST